MEPFLQVDNVLELGRKLVEQLDLEESDDTLGRWMAHYIAELIAKSEHSTGENKIVVQRECFAMILSLWKHRSALPNGKRPFEDIEPILHTIESLNPEHESRRYYRHARPPTGEIADTPEQAKWLKLADGFDHSAKILIGYCLSQAAKAALEKSKEWIPLAATIDGDNVPELIIHFVSNIARGNDVDELNELGHSILKDRIERLRGFLHVAETLANTMEESLRNLPPLNATPGDSSIHENLVIPILPKPLM